MHDGELWQVYLQNGQPIAGRGASDDEFAHDESLVMGNAHVWLWRHTTNGVKILLQKRSLNRKRSPGMLHISAAGHINVGETPVEAAVRETNEELGIVISPADLYFVHATRIPKHPNSILNVFTLQYDGDGFTFDDGEVEEVVWRSLADFKNMTKNPAIHNLIDQGITYFNPLIDAIEKGAE